MEKDRKHKILVIIALVFGIASLSVGFAAFSTTLNISSSATVSPDSSTFSVLFSSSGTSQLTDTVSGVGTGNATGSNASISGTTISGLNANFTAPGQTVTYNFYVRNAGSYVAHLANVDFGPVKSCAVETTATDSLVQAACDDISVSVSIDGNNYTKNAKVYDHSLAIGAYEPVVVTIEYASTGDRADGNFNVSFGDITLEYTTVYIGAPDIISFSIMGVSHQGEAGMTWGEWLESDYNNQGMAKEFGEDACSMTDFYLGKKTDVIVSGKSYPSSIVFCQ